MPTYTSTSREVSEKQTRITRSIVKKNLLLENFFQSHELPCSLKHSKKRLNIGDVHSWDDSILGVISYSRNTAHATHNLEYTNRLIETVHRINRVFSSNCRAKEGKATNVVRRGTYKRRDELLDKIRELKLQNQSLSNNVVEVYRAYIQIQEFVVSNKLDNDIYHRILQSQMESIRQVQLKSVK